MTLTTFRLYIKVINNLVFREDEDHVCHKTYLSTKSKRNTFQKIKFTLLPTDISKPNFIEKLFVNKGQL